MQQLCALLRGNGCGRESITHTTCLPACSLCLLALPACCLPVLTACSHCLQIQEAVESLDPEQLCVEYWAGKRDRQHAAAGLPVASGPARAPRAPR